MKNQKLNRRKFLRNTSLGVFGTGLLAKKEISNPSLNQGQELPKIKDYRTLGRTGFKVSDIGVGWGPIESVMKALLNAGVNYIDTSEYYGNGNSEKRIGNCIKDFDRKSIFITTKVWPRPAFTSTEDVLQRVRKSLERLQTDYIDCLMIHEVTNSEILKNEYFHTAMNQLKVEGKVRYVGVACHGHNWREDVPTETMEQIFGTAIDDGRFDVFLLVYNFINQDIGGRILKHCNEKAIGATIMKSNPMRWFGSLQNTLNNPENKPGWRIDLAQRFKDYTDQMMAYFAENNLKSNDETFRDLVIPFVLSNPNVNSILYGFNNFDDVETILSLSGKKLSLKDHAFLDSIMRDFGDLHCRLGCGICESHCPHHVPVNTIMRYHYYFNAKQQEKYAMQKYQELPGNKPDLCSDCDGLCEEACPYGVVIRSLLAMAHQNLSIDGPHYA